MTTAPMYCYRHPNRETRVSCSECGRPICTECMTMAPVGIRCPDHSGKVRGTAGIVRGVRRGAFEGTGALVTKALIAANVAVWLVNLAQGSSLTATGGSLANRWFLYGPYVARGDWWRLITSVFLHGSALHIGLNMLMLWWIGGPVEQAIGRGRFLALYLAGGLAGSAGALVVSPNSPTLGASGAIFGILGAALVFERQRHYVLGGSAAGIILVNLVLSFTIPNISIGAHVGGLIGGALCGLALTRFGRGHAAYGRLGLVGIGGIVAVGIAAVLVAYLKVNGSI